MRVSRSRRHFLKTAASTASLAILPWGTGTLPAGEGDPEQAVRGWTSFRNGLQNLGLADTSLPSELKLLWEFTTPDGTTSTPVIADGRVYMGTLSGDLHCFEIKTGREIWRYKSVEKVEPNSFAPGFNAAAALDAHAVYLGDDQGTFHAVDRASGKLKWKVVTDAEIVGGAQVLGNKIIFGSHDGHLYCHAAGDGARIWSVETRGPVNATPCISGKETFTTGCDQPILRVIDVEEGKQSAEVPLNSLLIAAAAVREGILYFGTDSGSVLALDWRNKQPAWQFAVPNRDQQIHSSPAVSDEVVVIGSRDKHLYCLERDSGQLRWSYQTRGKIDSSPVIVADRVYFGSADKNLYALNLTDGREVWKHFARQSITGSPAVAEGCLVVGTDSSNGRILCFG